MYYITIIDPDGSFSPVTAQETCPDYSRIRESIGGGYIESIPHFNRYGDRPCVVFGDEEAKLKGLDLNAKATYLWYACLVPDPFRPDTLHGAMCVIAADTETELREL